MKSLFRFSRLFCFIALVIAPCAMMVTEVVLYSQNSLYLNNDWIVQKRLMRMTVMGSDDFLLSRHPLAQNILNLGSFFAFQSVVYRQALKIDQVEFNFNIEGQSYLDFTYGHKDLGFSGIRLSRSSITPSGSFESSPQGRFIRFDNFSVPTLMPGWHKAVFLNSRTGLTLKIDNGPYVQTGLSNIPEGRIGFRAGSDVAKIDNLFYQRSTGQKIHLSFRNTKNYFHTYLFHFSILFIAGLLLSKLTMGKFVSDSKNAVFPWILISLVAFFCAGSWYLFDYFYYSKLIPDKSPITRALMPGVSPSGPDIERLRFLLFQDWYQLTGGEVIKVQALSDRGYPLDRVSYGPIYCSSTDQPCKQGITTPSATAKIKKSFAYRIIFIGTSQTFGAGANTLEDTFFVRIHRMLSHSLKPKIQLESINIAQSGKISTDLLLEYKANHLSSRPDLVVINLSNNDTSRKILLKNLKEILIINQLHGIKTVLIEEANFSGSQNFATLTGRHKILRSLALQFQVPILPMNQFLNETENSKSGNLWCDFVHLSSYGQDLAARFLAPQILKELLSIPIQKRSLPIED